MKMLVNNNNNNNKNMVAQIIKGNLTIWSKAKN